MRSAYDRRVASVALVHRICCVSLMIAPIAPFFGQLRICGGAARQPVKSPPATHRDFSEAGIDAEFARARAFQTTPVIVGTAHAHYPSVTALLAA
jgi:hypothetical protein